MLYHLLYPLRDVFIVFNVFRYITFRSAYAIITALLITLILGPYVIRWLAARQVGENIREDVPRNHLAKAGTPTMGGILILLAILVPTLLWARWDEGLVWIALLGTMVFGLVGFLDDYLKLRRPNTGGMRGKPKLLLQVALGFGLMVILVNSYGSAEFASRLSVPFFKKVMPDLGWAYPLFGALVVVGASNAVNLTDGLDGLATGPVIVAMVAYAIIAYVVGNAKFAAYLNIVHVPGAGELTVFCGSAVGASLGFLWYNAYPAELFMGNVGALALGAALGIVAAATKHELLLVLVGGIFVIEAVSVVLQVASFKSTGRRVFRMAPLHHHFEMKGWAEPKIIVRFWIVAIALALLSLSTLKLR